MKRVTNLKNRDGDVSIECNAIMTWVNYLAYNDNIKKLGLCVAGLLQKYLKALRDQRLQRTKNYDAT